METENSNFDVDYQGGSKILVPVNDKEKSTAAIGYECKKKINYYK